jgi:RNA polymerase-binding transcription factor DksA
MNSIINQTEHKNKGVKSSNFNLNLNNYSNKNKNNGMSMVNKNADETKSDNKQTFKAQPVKKNGKINFGAMLQRIEGMRGGCSGCGKKR